MNLDGLIKKAWGEYKANLKSLLGFTTVWYALPLLIISILVSAWLYFNLWDQLIALKIESNDTAEIYKLMFSSIPGVLLIALSTLFTIFCSVFTTAGLIKAPLESNKYNMRQLTTAAGRGFGRYLLISIFFFAVFIGLLAVVGGIVFISYVAYKWLALGVGIVLGLALIVFLIWLSITWSFSIYSYLGRSEGLFDSLRRSADMVWGRRWLLLGYGLIMVLLYFAFSFILQMASLIITLPLILFHTPVTSFLADVIGTMVSMIIYVFLSPWMIIFFKTVYQDWSSGKNK